MIKEELINLLLHDPLMFERMNLMDDLSDCGLTFDDIRNCVRRIYDLSESQLWKSSNANVGIMGMLNRRNTSRRINRFNSKIKKLKKADDHVIIYAEGDSWFQFPYFIKDIIDWLNMNKSYVIYSDAYGGDWITNMVYESQYISALSLLKPDYFLISGGGNDMVGDQRLAIMVKLNNKYPKYTSINPLDDPDLTDVQRQLIMKAQDHITKEFYALMLVIKAQYLKLLGEMYEKESTQKQLITITQGYDYAIPSFDRCFSFRYPFKKFLNHIMDNGCWLKRPLKIRGIFDETLQKALVMAFIYEFNLIFIDIATRKNFINVYHIDCRGLAQGEDDWFDELHYKRNIYRIVASAYSHIIDNHGNCEKVVRAADFRQS